jgi:predicted phosphodiesterase
MRDHSIASVCGNEDRILVEHDCDAASASHRDTTVKNLAPHDVQWLSQLKMTLYLQEDICLCHATPTRDDVYLLYKVTACGVVARPEEELLNLLAACKARIIVVGHAHIPSQSTLGERTVINVGSVGLQAYVDDTPYRHSMETGDPLARYTILSFDSGSCNAHMYEVEYDWNSAADVARKNGSAEWQRWLRTRRVT